MQGRHREIILGFTLLQIIVLAVFGYTPYPDSEGYIGLATDSLTYGQPYPVAQKLDDLAFIWNVGAINLTALSLFLFDSITPLLVVYCLLKGATAWLLYDVAKHLMNERMATIALLLYVVYPANYGEATSLLSELPSFFFSILGIRLALCNKQNTLAGAAIALGNWFRPMGLVYLLALFIYNRKHTLRTVAGYAAVVCIIGSACYLRTGHFIYQAKTGWMALLQYSVDHTPTTDDDALPIVSDANAIDKDRIWRNRFMAWLARHPREYIAQMPKKFIDTYASDNVNLCAFLDRKPQRTYLYNHLSMRTLIADFPRYTPVQMLTIVNLLYYYFLLLTFVAGCVIAWRQKTWKNIVFPLNIIVISTALILLVGHGEARFHNPMMPFFIMIATSALTHIADHRPTRHHANTDTMD